MATVIAGLVLSAAYSWLWNVAALAARTDDKAQAATVAGAVARAVAGDVRAAVGVVEPPAGRDPSRSLALSHDHVDKAHEDVLIVWDPARGVVWRNASGTYLADHVTRFDVSYGLADGRRVAGGDMSAPDWAEVRLARVELTVTFGTAVAARALERVGGAGMRPRCAADGYAMLAVLLVMVLAAIFALVVVGAVHSLQVVERSDAAGWRAESLAEQAVSAVNGALRWRPGAVSGTTGGGDADVRQSWRASWTPTAPVVGDVWPRLRVHVSGGCRERQERRPAHDGAARRTVGHGGDVCRATPRSRRRSWCRAAASTSAAASGAATT